MSKLRLRISLPLDGLEGGTTFAFVIEGIEAALEQVRQAAGSKDVSLACGAKAAQQYLAAGLKFARR